MGFAKGSIRPAHLICPTGGPVNLLSSPVRKNIPLRDLLEAALLIPPSCSRQEGRTRRHERWARDAMDAMARKTSAANRGRRSRVVLAPRRWRQVSLT